MVIVAISSGVKKVSALIFSKCSSSSFMRSRVNAFFSAFAAAGGASSPGLHACKMAVVVIVPTAKAFIDSLLFITVLN